MSDPLAGSRAGRMQRVASELGAAFQQRASYAPAHPQVRSALDRVVSALEDVRIQDGAPEVSLLLLEGQLLLDQQEVPDGAYWSRGILRAFDRHGIPGLTLLPGLDAAELSGFLESCLGPGGPASTAHVRVGQGGYAAVAARVVAVADTWETIRARASIRVDEALSVLRARSGTFLDPALVEVLAGVVLPGAVRSHHSR